MKSVQKKSNKAVPWFFAVVGETAAVILLNLLPYVIRNVLRNEALFVFNAVFGVPFAFFGLFSLCFFKSANERRFFMNVCREKGVSLPGSQLSGSAVLGLIVFLLKAAALLFFISPAAILIFAFFRFAGSLPLKATLCLLAFAALLLLPGVLFFRRVSALLFLSGYVYLLCPQKNIAGCIRTSAETMASNLSRYRKLRRELFMYSLLCVFVFSLPYALHRRRTLKNSFAFGLLFLNAEQQELLP